MSLRRRLNQALFKYEKYFETHNRIEVSRAAILHNFDLFRSLSGQDVIPVLKSNAYGHGIRQVAMALRGRTFPYIAVDGYFEALRIREVSKQPVLIMGAITNENFARMRYDNFAFVVQDVDSIMALGKTGKRIKVHLEVNTGMNRYGCEPHEIEHITQEILHYPNLELEGVMSHLADSDGDDPDTVKIAALKFDQAVEWVRALGANPSLLHLAQTAGSAVAKSQHANTMRLGIGLYGINPFMPKHPNHKKLVDLKPALQLISTITRIHDLQKGDKVSYNYTYTAPHTMRIGVLPLGYYEGVNRALSNKGVVKIGKKFQPIVGRVCMNHTMISLENVVAIKGTEVVVYSSNPSDRNAIDSIAAEHGLFNYNLLTALSADVRRILVD